GAEIFRRLLGGVGTTTLEQNLRQPAGRVDAQNQDRQLLGVVIQLDPRRIDLFRREGFDAFERGGQIGLGLFGQKRTDEDLEAGAVHNEPVITRQQNRQLAEDAAVEVQRDRDRD